MLHFKDTIPENLDRIITLEQADRKWICPYSRERHLLAIAKEDERHISVFRESDEDLIGFIILLQIQNPNRSLEFRRIVIADKGKGYGREALRWIKRYCFEELKFHRLWFDVFTDNERAIHLYESEGFRREGRLSDALLVGGAYRSLYLYAMLEEEYLR